MNITFLGQGYEPLSKNSVGNNLLKFLSHKEFHTFIGISAFASESGVFGLSSHIESAKQNFSTLILIVGIDQEGTSKEALELILSLRIDSYIFYQSEPPIFHPKIYLFEGDNEVKLIVGSSNLTRTGLFTNVESSLLIEFDIGDKDGLLLLTELKTYYKTLFNFSDKNIFKITQAVIDDFNSKGIVPDEIERRKIYGNKKSAGTISITASTEPVTIPKRVIAKVPANFPLKPKVKAPESAIIQPKPNLIAAQPQAIFPPSPVSQVKKLVWQKKKLPKSDAQRVPSGTAITANVTLSQARFKVNGITIDQKLYFRKKLFNNLTWEKTKLNKSSYEESYCKFDVTILGTRLGLFDLKLSHDPSRIAGQGNTPTWLHWGDVLINYLRNKVDITGKSFNLYFSHFDSAFVILIE